MPYALCLTPYQPIENGYVFSLKLLGILTMLHIQLTNAIRPIWSKLYIHWALGIVIASIQKLLSYFFSFCLFFVPSFFRLASFCFARLEPILFGCFKQTQSWLMHTLSQLYMIIVLYHLYHRVEKNRIYHFVKMQNTQIKIDTRLTICRFVFIDLY